MAITIPNTFADKTGQVQLEDLDENFSQIAIDLNNEVTAIQNEVDAALNEVTSVVSGIEDPVAMSLLFGPDPQVDVPSDLYYRLNSTVTMPNDTAANRPFGVSANLNSNTVYEFESLIAIQKVGGTATAQNHNISWGGTATVNNIGYRVHNFWVYAGFTAITTAQQNTMFINTTAATTLQTGYSSANVYIVYIMHGTVSIGTGGTFAPLSAMTTAQGSYVTQVGSYIRFREIGQAGSNSLSGVWS